MLGTWLAYPSPTRSRLAEHTTLDVSRTLAACAKFSLHVCSLRVTFQRIAAQDNIHHR
jgi:hypothetical protein